MTDSTRVKIPFGIAQTGKSFRNEITPRNFTFRSREFEQMEIEFFIKPDEVVQKTAGAVAQLAGLDPKSGLQTPQPNWGWEIWHKYWVEQRLKWYESIGLGRDMLEQYWQEKEELAHYAKRTVDIMYRFPMGWSELMGIANRTDFDLKQHAKFSGKSLTYFDEERKEHIVPFVIEPSAGVDRALLAFLLDAYQEEEVRGDKRVLLRLHRELAPITIAVLPLLKKRPEIVSTAHELRTRLAKRWRTVYDDTAAIGRLYRRQDEVGTPYCITLDFETLEDDAVTIRHRDTMSQERIALPQVESWLLDRLPPC